MLSLKTGLSCNQSAKKFFFYGPVGSASTKTENQSTAKLNNGSLAFEEETTQTLSCVMFSTVCQALDS